MIQLPNNDNYSISSSPAVFSRPVCVGTIDYLNRHSFCYGNCLRLREKRKWEERRKIGTLDIRIDGERDRQRL